MDVIRITTPLGEAELHRVGAHLATWTPRGERPVLFLSPRAVFAPGKAIRGGVPIIFPWFGPGASGAHGFARTAEWEVEQQSTNEIGMVLRPDQATRAVWNYEFELRLRVLVGSTLEVRLETTNAGSQAFRFEEALHTYLSVGDVRQVSITGLEGSEYLDKVDGSTRKRQGAEPISFTGERDQVHVNTASTCTVHDPVWSRRIVVQKTGSMSTVVWNPWAEKIRALTDMEPDGWRKMLCVESGNIGENSIELAPGATHRLTASIRVER